MRKLLTPSFFDRPTLTVAEELLGKYLVRRYRGNPSTWLKARTVASMITETEAYDGWQDRASHAHRGETPRNRPMFDKPGTIYVYFTYGMHYMLNLVTGKRGFPAAVLIRGVEEINGPGRLTKRLKIDKALNHKPLGRVSGLWVEDREVKVKKSDIKRTPRIGVRYAGAWAHKPYRFVLKTRSARP